MYRRDGSTPVKRVALILIAALASATSACGSSGEEPSREAAEVVKELQDLKPGEVLIKGASAPRVYGPYTFDAGTYRLRFEHGAAGASPGRLVVALQTTPRPASRSGTVVIDSRRARGTESVSIPSKFFVNVKQARADYVLRFTPSP